jgi:hypothetical protein
MDQVRGGQPKCCVPLMASGKRPRSFWQDFSLFRFFSSTGKEMILNILGNLN